MGLAGASGALRLYSVGGSNPSKAPIIIMKISPLQKKVLMDRGYCCGYKCQNCPYEPKHVKGATKITDNKTDE